MFGKVNKNEFFIVYSYYEELRGNDATNFPWKSNTEGQGSFEVDFFCLDGFLGKDIHNRQPHKR